MSPAEEKPHSAIEHADAPDPDEDDLDDLDEMLDEFSATKIDSSKASTAPASGPGRPGSSSKDASTKLEQPQGATSEVEDDFTKQLQAGMEEMLQEFEKNPEMVKQFEEMMTSLGAPAPPPASSGADASKSQSNAAGYAPPPSSGASANATQKSSEDAFQDTIRRTMERMRESSSSAAAAAANPAEDDIMASLLKELSSSAGGEGGDDAFSKMLLGMMEQLTNKDILYDPMKELDSKFPAWLQEHHKTLSKDDEEKYLKQHQLVKEIVGRFERKGYSDDNAEDREYIVERMQKMQEAGAPPPDLVGDTNVAQEMLADLDNGCPQQ